MLSTGWLYKTNLRKRGPLLAGGKRILIVSEVLKVVLLEDRLLLNAGERLRHGFRF